MVLSFDCDMCLCSPVCDPAALRRINRGVIVDAGARRRIVFDADQRDTARERYLAYARCGGKAGEAGGEAPLGTRNRFGDEPAYR
jgi:hypothetical protein